MSRDIALLLIGASIALVSSITTALVQHFLHLRVERIKRAQEKEEREAQESKQRLSEGTEVQLARIRKMLGSLTFAPPNSSSAERSENEEPVRRIEEITEKGSD